MPRKPSKSQANGVPRARRVEASKPDVKPALAAAIAAYDAEDKALPASGLKEQRLHWLWDRYVLNGACTLVAGPTGVGKTTFLAALAAHITGGPRLGGGKPCVAQNALWLTIENELELEVRRKLRAAGANVDRVRFPYADEYGHTHHRLTLPTESFRLENLCIQYNPSAVFIEPMDSFLPDGFDINAGAAVRGLLDALHHLARRLKVAIVFTRHWRKAREGDPLGWINGAAAWSQCPRTVLMLHDHPDGDGRRILKAEKSGLVKRPPSWVYVLDDAGDAPRFLLTDQVDADDEDLPDQVEARAERKTRAEVAEFLRNELAAGEVKASDVIKRAEALGIHRRTLARERARLGIGWEFRGRIGTGEWMYLPAKPDRKGG
jgi:RecA-family ATPase